MCIFQVFLVCVSNPYLAMTSLAKTHFAGFVAFAEPPPNKEHCLYVPQDLH